jgi:hypothetical protein
VNGLNSPPSTLTVAVFPAVIEDNGR